MAMTLDEPHSTLGEPAGLAAGQVLGDRYRIERRIGGGGMGEVYLGRHLRTGRLLAVKLLGADAAREPESLQRFEAEARVLGRLGHPGIVGIHDFDTTPEGRPYLVMDLLEGEELAARLDRDGALPWSEASRIFEEVSGALHAAHGAGVLHRDLKPGNIFLARSEAAPERAMLLDFGLAKSLTAEEKRLTRTGLIMGTPLYMSPEQARGHSLDVRSDLYSLAAVLYEILTGKPPFEGSSWTAILSALLLEPPPPLPRELVRRLPPQVPEALMRALSKDPAFRPPDVLTFATAVLMRPPQWAGAGALSKAARGVEGVGRGQGTRPGGAAEGERHEGATARTLPSVPPGLAVPLPRPDGALGNAFHRRGLPSGLLSRRLLWVGAAGFVGLAILALAFLWGPLGERRGSGSPEGVRELASGASESTPLRRRTGEIRGVDALAKAGGSSPEARAMPDTLAVTGVVGTPDTPGSSGTADPSGSRETPPVAMGPRPDSSQGRATSSGPGARTAPEGARDAGARPRSSGGPAGGKRPEAPGVPEPRAGASVSGDGLAGSQPPARSAGQPPARSAGQPLTEAEVLARLPANEQAIIAAQKRSDWSGCIRASMQPPETERTLQMRVACAWSAKRYDVVLAACQTFMRRYPVHPFSRSCQSQIRAIRAMKGSSGAGGPTP